MQHTDNYVPVHAPPEAMLRLTKNAKVVIPYHSETSCNMLLVNRKIEAASEFKLLPILILPILILLFLLLM